MPPVSNARRGRAATILREGGSFGEAARAAKVDKRTVTRWMNEPAFKALVRGERIRELHLPPDDAEPEHVSMPSTARISEDGAITDIDIDPSADPEVRGNRDPDTGRPLPFSAEVAASVVQLRLPDDREVPITYAGLLDLHHDRDAARTFLRAATDFRHFLTLWQFADTETGVTRALGDGLWESQEIFCRAASTHPWIFFLKARKLGETTIECAFDAWRGRFYTGGARVHLFSRRDDAAVELLDAVEYGMLRLPGYMHLPLIRRTSHIYELAAGHDDRRLWKAYPANETTSVEQTCIHGHVDELARMGSPSGVWQAIEPTMAGSCHIVTTGLGPTNPASELYRRSEAGDTRLRAVFIPATARPGRDASWLAAKQRELGRAHALQEYPLTVEDALAGTGDFVFSPDDLDAATADAYGLGAAQERHKYVAGIDLGVTDATVIVVLDTSEAPMLDVVHFFRATGLSYPQIQNEILRTRARYPGVLLAIEQNAMGAAVTQNLGLPEGEVALWNTTQASKARIIQSLAVHLESQLLKIPAECEQLLRELRGYQIPDHHIQQDAVMATAIAVEHAAKAQQRRGRIMSVFHL